MKVLLVSINARYTHSNPALYALKQGLLHEAEGLIESIDTLEFNINQTPEYILGETYHSGADLIGISCYIWNRREALALAAALKKIMPHVMLVFGGPEVSSLAVETISAVPAIDFILRGEGELSFPLLMRTLAVNGDLSAVPGLVYRDASGEVRTNPQMGFVNHPDLHQLPFPYTVTDLAELQEHIIYYESSRGCPYHCGYCLSSQESGLRFLPLERVKADILLLVESGTKLVKFVDRTFNCNRDRATHIWHFLLTETPPEVQFHFEIGADLLDHHTLRLLAETPPGKFQFEVGVQSTNPEVLKAVNRPDRTKEISENIQRLAEFGNIHLHLDLIAGLPLETRESFAASFDDVYRMNPHQIQLGFLKVLPGTPISYGADDWGLVYQSDPPYEILATPSLSYHELWKLKRIEELVEVYNNTSRFTATLGFAIAEWFAGSAFAFYADFAEWWITQGLYRVKHKFSAYYDHLYQYFHDTERVNTAFIDLLTLDFAASEQYLELPTWSRPTDSAELKELHHKLAQDSSVLSKVLPHLVGLRAREITKRTRLVSTRNESGNDLALIDYTKRDPVTGRARLIQLKDHF